MSTAGRYERLLVWLTCLLFSLVCWAAVCVAIWRAVQWIGGGP